MSAFVLPSAITIQPLTGLPEIVAGDDLARRIVDATAREGVEIANGDVFVVTQKIVSKAEGSLVHLKDVEPSPLARQWSERFGKDARVVELALREAVRIVRMDRGVLITETRHGFICANSGVDASNVPDGCATLLPRDPDRSASTIRDGLRVLSGVDVGVIIADTFGRPWREGQTNVAIGVAGIAPLVDYRGQSDRHGRRLESTVIAAADEMAAAAELAMGKTRDVPVVLVRGLEALLSRDGSGRDLLRRADRDLFR